MVFREKEGAQIENWVPFFRFSEFINYKHKRMFG